MMADMLRLLPLLFVLFAGGRVATHLPDAGVVAMVLVLATAMSANGALRATLERRMALRTYLLSGSPWRRRLRGGWLLWAGAWLRALPLALLLCVALARPASATWLLPVAWTMPLLVALWHGVGVCTRVHVVAAYRPVAAWRLGGLLWLLVLLPLLTWQALGQAQVDYRGIPLSQALSQTAAAPAAASALLDVLLRVAAMKDVLVMWLGQQWLPGLPGLGGPWAQLAAWALLLATDALVLWSYLHLCGGVWALAHWRRCHRILDEARMASQ